MTTMGDFITTSIGGIREAILPPWEVGDIAEVQSSGSFSTVFDKDMPEQYAEVVTAAGCDPTADGGGLSEAGLLRVYTDLRMGEVDKDFQALGLGR